MIDKKEVFLELINNCNEQLSIGEIHRRTGIPKTTLLRYCNKYNYKPLKLEEPWNKGLTKESSDSLNKMSQKMLGRKKGPRTQEEKEKISSTMKKNAKSGGFREKGGRGDKHIYRDIILNSDTTLGMAKMLDEEDINWEQPLEGFSYVNLQGETRLLYMDFYLPDYDLYISVRTSINSVIRKHLLDIKKNHNIKLMIVDELLYKRLMYNKIKEILAKY